MRHLFIGLLALTFSTPVSGVTRDMAMETASTFAEHIWSSTQANFTADCSPSYTSLFLENYGVGGPHKGLSYDWGGWDTLPNFVEKIASGYGAGTHSSDGVLSCTTGQDCSGFVSRCWQTPKKHGTSTFHEVSYSLNSPDDLIRGDAINKAGSHMVLFDSLATNGQPLFYESAGGSVRKVWFNAVSGWSYLNGYVPTRYDLITDADVTLPGTLDAPIQVTSFPFTDSRNTFNYGSSVFDTYSCAPETGELGPEVFYELVLPQPGNLIASVACGPGIDIDLHLLSALDPDACLDRAHIDLGPIALEAGVYYLVADTWSNESGAYYPGLFDLFVDFETTVPAPDPEVETETDDWSCVGICGDAASSGCGCGLDCVVAGDCCEDACDTCGACDPPVDCEECEGDPEANDTDDTDEVNEANGEEPSEPNEPQWNVDVGDPMAPEGEDADRFQVLPPIAPGGVNHFNGPDTTASEESGCQQSQHTGSKTFFGALLGLCLWGIPRRRWIREG